VEARRREMIAAGREDMRGDVANMLDEGDDDILF
jgi:hypothetical protein